MILITFLIPVFNEEKTVVNAVNQILSLKFLKKEIIIIDNGSTDQSQKLIKTFSKKKNIRIVLRKKNLGYGASIKQGVRMARGKYMFIQFSDTEYDHRVSLKMFRMSEKYNADAVFGSRLKNMSFNQKLIAIKNKPAFLATILITKMYNIFYSKNFTDVIGSKFYRLDIFKKINLKENNIDWDFELKNRLISGPYKILEVFTKYKPRPNPEEKSVKFYHMFSIIYLMIKYKLKRALEIY
ncbi:COG1216 Predicted glycosyltransferases [Candidatus Pelagibacterales bacterium]